MKQMKQIRTKNGITIIAEVESTGMMQMNKIMKVMFELPDGSACEVEALPDCADNLPFGGWPAQFRLGEALRKLKSAVNNVQNGKHGGKREGAGRKAEGDEPKVAFPVSRASSKVVQIINDEAKRLKVSKTEALEGIVIAWKDQKDGYSDAPLS